MRLMTLAIGVAMLLTMMVSWTFAHDNPEDWIGQRAYKNKVGNLCCGHADCHPVPTSDVRVTETGYLLPPYIATLKGAPTVVPFGSAQPSEDQAFWICIWGSEMKCFFAPIGGT